MNKLISKKIFLKYKIKTPKFFSIKKFDFSKTEINKIIKKKKKKLIFLLLQNQSMKAQVWV